jgi:hypothetical protein
MLKSVIVSVFEANNVAEVNSSKLFEYGHSLNKYFNNTNNSNVYKQYFKWFEKPISENTNNSLLKDFEKSFCEFFF